jgi:lipopolysaccharide/colanic/teichoic acid biosynthesis glycosyltransferase
MTNLSNNPLELTVRNENKVRTKFSMRLDAVLRRILDIFISFFTLLFLSPVFLFIGIMIKKETPGPFYYKGRRVGKNGKEFFIVKFRTMYEEPKSYSGSPITARNDPRITHIGKILRDSKLNELPQFWNVFIGDMSLVGPRPEDPDIARKWPEEVRRELLSVRPGITSPASVMYRDEEQRLDADSIMDDYLTSILPDKLRLDQIYLRTRNILSDLDVIFLTLVILVPRIRENIVSKPTLYFGPIAKFLNRYASWFVYDLLVCLFWTGVIGIIWRQSGPFDIGLVPSMIFGCFIAFLFSVFNWMLGLNQIAWSTARPGEVIPLAMSCGLATAIIIMINLIYFSGAQRFPNTMLVMIGGASFISWLIARYRERLLTGLASRWIELRGKRIALGERVLIVGAGSTGRITASIISKGEFVQVFTIIGYIDDDPRKQGMIIDGHRVLGTCDDLASIIRKWNIGIVLLAISKMDQINQKKILSTCKTEKVHTVEMTDLLTEIKTRLRNKDTSSVVDISREALVSWIDKTVTLVREGKVQDVEQQLHVLRRSVINDKGKNVN